MKALIVFAIIVLIIVGIILYIYLEIKKGVKSIFRGYNGSQILGMIKEADLRIQHEPKSVSGGDSLFLPLITKDYPDIDINLLKSNIKSCIMDIFTCIEKNDRDYIKNKYDENILTFYDNLTSEKNNTYNEIKFHKCAISNYVKNQQHLTIIFQIAFQYYNNKQIVQKKYEINYTYHYNDENDNVIRCSHCGAPISKLGNKICQYCNSSINVNSGYVWIITDIKDLI